MPSTDIPAKTAVEHFNAAAPHYEKYTGGCTRELARLILDLPELGDAGAQDSVVLDNACGTGIVAEELILRSASPGGAQEWEPATTANAAIHMVDAAPNMVAIARGRIDGLVSVPTGFEIHDHVMLGESLDFEDSTFSHSITNLGILFYVDGPAGARELYRTLRPGGVAVVTSWSDLGYLEGVIKPAQLEIRPNEEPYKLPISANWFSPSYLQATLTQGGFSDVKMLEMKAHYGAATVDDVARLLRESFQGIWKEWSEEEKTRFSALVREKCEGLVEKYVMPDGSDGWGIPMTASVAVCRK